MDKTKNTIRILLIGGDDVTKAVLINALDEGNNSIEVIHTNDLDEALETLVTQSLNLCFIREQADMPGAAESICADIKEAGIRVPIVVLMGQLNADRENELRGVGAYAAIPWDGTQFTILRNLVHLTLELTKSQDKLRKSNDQLVLEIRTVQDERERAEAESAELIVLAENYAMVTRELEILNQEKNKFFSIIAHDLRSPFTSLLGFSALLQQTAEKLSPKEVAEAAGHIHNSGNRVFKLLENLLEWSRLQMDKVTITPLTFSISDIAERTIDILGPVAEEKDIAITETRTELSVYADPNMVDTVIRNLVNNAIKFTPNGGKISIAYELEDSGQILRVNVKDTGLGMKPENTAKLFDLSTSVSTDGTDGEKGTGLGLLMCQDLVTRNNGIISVQSEQGKGSTFSFTLPVNAPSDPE